MCPVAQATYYSSRCLHILLEELYFYILGIEMPESFIEFMLAEPIFSFISVVLVAPIIEEFLFRGFLYAQLRRSLLKDWGAIAVSSLIWTAIHFQYEIGILFFFANSFPNFKDWIEPSKAQILLFVPIAK